MGQVRGDDHVLVRGKLVRSPLPIVDEEEAVAEAPPVARVAGAKALGKGVDVVTPAGPVVIGELQVRRVVKRAGRSKSGRKRGAGY